MTSRTVIVDNLAAALTSFGDVVRGLTATQWAEASLCPGWAARDVVVHTTTIESALLGWRPGDDSPFDAMRGIAEELAGLADGALLARFEAVRSARTAELTAMTDEAFDAPSLTPVGPGTYGKFMQIRVFDVWAHERDIRVALGLPGDDGGPVAEMALDEVEASLGYIVGKKIGVPDGSSIAIELAGPVTRVMSVQVDGRARVVDHLDSPTVTLTTDSLTFMLLACGRIDPDGPIGDGRVSWSGDDELGARAARHLAFTM
jgi:uncharacterized protein (TIGR03083 family)